MKIVFLQPVSPQVMTEWGSIGKLTDRAELGIHDYAEIQIHHTTPTFSACFRNLNGHIFAGVLHALPSAVKLVVVNRPEVAT